MNVNPGTHPHKTDVEVKAGVVSVSTTRFKKYGRVRGVNRIPQDDESSKIVVKELGCVDYILVEDSIPEIIKAIFDLNCNTIITVGGTGITPKDVTVEAVRAVLKKEIEGFGEVFRYESYREVGMHAILSRAIAGVLENGNVVFCLPGSKKAVELGVRLIKPVLKHVLSHAKGLK